MSNLEPWLMLKLDFLPNIAQEVEQISAYYIHLCDEVRKGNKQAYQDLIVLQARIRGRIDDFDKFYDRNYADYRIGYFEKMKLRLRKLISPHIDVNRLIYEETQNYNQQQTRQSPAKHLTPPHRIENVPQPQQQQISPLQQQQQQSKISPNKKTIDTNKKKEKETKKQSKAPIKKTPKAQDELIFTIKMSKEEYMQYVQAKAHRK